MKIDTLFTTKSFTLLYLIYFYGLVSGQQPIPVLVELTYVDRTGVRGELLEF